MEIKIADFGFSCYFDPKGKGAKLQTKLGSPLFMAPELIDRKKYDERVDIWAIGVILYYMLCGKYPFIGDDEDEFNDSIRKGKLTFREKSWKSIS